MAQRSTSRSLSPREQQVLALVAQGLSNIEIGQKLYLSDNTIKTHMARLAVALRARSRAHMVDIGWRQGLLTADTELVTATLPSRREARAKLLHEAHLEAQAVRFDPAARQARIRLLAAGRAA